MRIAHLSDIHLSSDNLTDLQNHYLTALLADMGEFQKDRPFDVIVISGDLIDKGGASFAPRNGYEILEQEFIKPIQAALNLRPSQIQFIAGNHDIDRALIDEHTEYFLADKLTTALANKILPKTEKEFTRENKRIEPFKTFEKRFHETDENYTYTNNESVYVFGDETGKVGFALINDSWRCSAELERDQHFFGANQLFSAKKVFDGKGTDLNVAVFHHPLDLISPAEKEEVENILESQNFQLALFGHSHRHKIEALISSKGGVVTVTGRSTFNKPDETIEKYQPGYSIIDLDPRQKKYKIFARKFMRSSGFRFDKDVDSLRDGEDSGTFEKNMHYALSQTTSAPEGGLPSGYSANVEKIVKLLIGRSLYPNQYAFVRELIQNAVDACTRKKEKYSHSQPTIVVNVSQTENYFEVSDEGDGMSRRVLREHFAVIGKSISQEINDASANINLISQFGIGFISAFIAAEKVFVSTKSEGEDRVDFQISDVFKGFEYIQGAAASSEATTGTTVKVHLKKGFNAQEIANQVMYFCRHVPHLALYLNGNATPIKESWNTENGRYRFSEKTTQFQLELALGSTAQTIVASNSGFLITQQPFPIIPFKFPYFIVGEINLAPRMIDFDLSRSNVIESSKSFDIRKRISVALKNLFRQALDANDLNLKPTILSYLQYYLSTIDNFKAQYSMSYADFYSKSELIEMCTSMMELEFEGKKNSLKYTIETLMKSPNGTIYLYDPATKQDLDEAFAEYLYFTGQVVARLGNFSASFRDGIQAMPLISVYQIICQHYNIKLVQIGNLPNLLQTISISPDNLPLKVREQLSQVQILNNLKIQLIRLKSPQRAVIMFGATYLLNIEHRGFAAILGNDEKISEEAIRFYIQGLLRVIPELNSAY